MLRVAAVDYNESSPTRTIPMRLRSVEKQRPQSKLRPLGSVVRSSKQCICALLFLFVLYQQKLPKDDDDARSLATNKAVETKTVAWDLIEQDETIGSICRRRNLVELDSTGALQIDGN